MLVMWAIPMFGFVAVNGAVIDLIAQKRKSPVIYRIGAALTWLSAISVVASLYTALAVIYDFEAKYWAVIIAQWALILIVYIAYLPILYNAKIAESRLKNQSRRKRK